MTKPSRLLHRMRARLKNANKLVGEIGTAALPLPPDINPHVEFCVGRCTGELERALALTDRLIASLRDGTTAPVELPHTHAATRNHRPRSRE